MFVPEPSNSGSDDDEDAGLGEERKKARNARPMKASGTSFHESQVEVVNQEGYCETIPDRQSKGKGKASDQGQMQTGRVDIARQEEIPAVNEPVTNRRPAMATEPVAIAEHKDSTAPPTTHLSSPPISAALSATSNHTVRLPLPPPPSKSRASGVPEGLMEFLRASIAASAIQSNSTALPMIGTFSMKRTSELAVEPNKKAKV